MLLSALPTYTTPPTRRPCLPVALARPRVNPSGTAVSNGLSDTPDGNNSVAQAWAQWIKTSFPDLYADIVKRIGPPPPSSSLRFRHYGPWRKQLAGLGDFFTDFGSDITDTLSQSGVDVGSLFGSGADAIGSAGTDLGSSWIDTLVNAATKGFSAYTQYQQNQDLYNLNLQRLQKGLPPVTQQTLTGQPVTPVTVPTSATGSNWIVPVFLGLGALVLVSVLKK